MADNSSEHIKVRDGAVAWQEVDGEAILLDLERSMYLGLNGSAAVLWPPLMRGTNRDELVDLLLQTYEVDQDQARADVDEFLDRCRAQNLILP